MGLAKTNLAILGLQWGDEGKGKVVDLLSPKFKQVVRFQGGNNAGHTVVVDGVSIALHQVPSGALHPGCFLVVGNGVVLNLEVFQQELDRLSARGFDLSGRLLMSEKAHVILPHHIALDQWRELRADKVGAQIGTTGRGIGPAYEMKAARMGIRLGDLLHPETLAERIEPGYEEVRIRLGANAGLPSLEAVIEGLLRIAEPFLPFIGDAQGHLQAAWERGESILFEGAQATLLDIDHGTYPFVTSSSCSLGGLFTGTGLPPKALDKILGIAKAYTTRVGAGPFPAELLDATGERLRQVGREFGTTTGRPRRCGWFDAPITAHACRTNGVDGLAIMKLDVLDELPRISLCSGYRYKGKLLKDFPHDYEALCNVKPVYEEMSGWQQPISGVREYNKLPAQARRYVERMEKLVGVAIKYISIGSERDEIIVR